MPPTIVKETNEPNLTSGEILSLVVGSLVARKHDLTIRISEEEVARFVNLNANGIDVTRDTRNGDFVVKLVDVPEEG